MTIETVEQIEDRLRSCPILYPEAMDPAERAEVATMLEQRGFNSFLVTIDELNRRHCQEIPRVAGVYLVMEPERLEILYIGKAGGPGIKATLQSRIQSYLRGGHSGKYAGHQGGKDIWNLPGSGNLLISWKQELNAREEEKALIAKYEAEHGRLPFANHKR